MVCSSVSPDRIHRISDPLPRAGMMQASTAATVSAAGAIRNVMGSRDPHTKQKRLHEPRQQECGKYADRAALTRDSFPA